MEGQRPPAASLGPRAYSGQLSKEVRSTQWLGIHENHEILVELRGRRLRLSIDGEVRDERLLLSCLTRRGPLLTGRLEDRSQVSLAHIYRRSLFPLEFETQVGRFAVTMNLIRRPQAY